MSSFVLCHRYLSSLRSEPLHRLDCAFQTVLRWGSVVWLEMPVQTADFDLQFLKIFNEVLNSKRK